MLAPNFDSERGVFKDTSFANTENACYEGNALAKQEWKPANDGRPVAKDIAADVYATQAPWLPFAAEKYRISASLNDYLLVPVSIILSDVPNRNGKAFPLSTLTEFNPEAGTLSYQTWKGKPTFYEHANSNIVEAKGVIFDSVLRPAPQYVGHFYTVDLLLGFDRQKDNALTQKIIDRSLTTYSMGSLSSDYSCSICGASMRNNHGSCEHLSVRPGRKPLIHMVGKRLAYLNIAAGLVGFECSAVGYPAEARAEGPVVFS